ncbi:MAG: gliding motility-associated C-terminal domain-containing protein [Bacteroidales bacterium]|nr:gliding motility-associated C-terminal domain-containing protein [Bacteroidales bacterium]
MRKVCVFFFMVISYSLVGLDPPSFRCIEVLPNGDVRLSWLPPADPTFIFDAYLIYSSAQPTGPFVLVDQISNYNQLSYIHVGASAQNQIKYYYLVTRYNAPNFQYSISSDTLATMKLSVINPMNGIALLQWNPLHAPLLNTHSSYQIWMEYPQNDWNILATTTNTQHTDTITVCHDSITYRIQVQDQSGCVSISSLSGGVFQNLIPPVNPGIDSVSIQNPVGHALIGWHPSPSTDTRGYVIYFFSSMAWVPIDTVWGRFNTSYVNTSSQANSQVETYAIASFDSCHRISPISSPHSTILLKASYDSCQRKVFLQWSAYHAWTAVKYLVYRKINSSSYTLVDSTQQLYYTDSLHVSQGTYCYFIRAKQLGKSSSSNEICFDVNLPPLPQFVYLRKATVFPDGSTQLSWFVDPYTTISSCKIYSSLDKYQWKLLNEIPYHPSGHYSWIDENKIANERPVYYKITTTDICGIEHVSSNVVRTMFLKAYPGEQLMNNLEWNLYEGWNGFSHLYLIKTPTHYIDTLVLELDPTFNSFQDDVSLWNETDGYFTYRLMAVENNLNPFGFQDTVFSNIAYVRQWPRLFVPQAFSPEGYNKTWCVFGVFVDKATYLLQIFNRWGELMFETTSLDDCWNGINDGKSAPPGAYIYQILMTFPDGTQFKKNGPVILIR